MKFLLLDAQEDEISAVVIANFSVVDEQGHLVAAAGSKRQAEELQAKYAAKYPAHRFHIVGKGESIG